MADLFPSYFKPPCHMNLGYCLSSFLVIKAYCPIKKALVCSWGVKDKSCGIRESMIMQDSGRNYKRLEQKFFEFYVVLYNYMVWFIARIS